MNILTTGENGCDEIWWRRGRLAVAFFPDYYALDGENVSFFKESVCATSHSTLCTEVFKTVKFNRKELVQLYQMSLKNNELARDILNTYEEALNENNTGDKK